MTNRGRSDIRPNDIVDMPVGRGYLADLATCFGTMAISKKLESKATRAGQRVHCRSESVEFDGAKRGQSCFILTWPVEFLLGVYLLAYPLEAKTSLTADVRGAKRFEASSFGSCRIGRRDLAQLVIRVGAKRGN